MGQYDSTYQVFTSQTQWSGLGNPTFTVTIKLGDNNAGAATLAELLVNSASGQFSWGVDSNGDVNSDGQYPSPNFVTVDFDVPVSSSPQSPAILTLPNSTAVSYSGAPNYNGVTNVLVYAQVNTGGTPTNSVTVIWSNVTITFYDASGNATTNPSAGTSPVACQGSGCAAGSNSLKALLTTPSGNFTPVRVGISGNLRLISTDSFYKNYGANLSASSMQAKILVWTS